MSARMMRGDPPRRTPCARCRGRCALATKLPAAMHVGDPRFSVFVEVISSGVDDAAPRVSIRTRLHWGDVGWSMRAQ